MSKNQSIKSFFTSSTTNSKKKEEVEEASPKELTKNKLDETTSKSVNSPKPASRAASSVTNKEANNSKKPSTDDNLYDNEEGDDIVEVEKENKLVLKSSKKNLVKTAAASKETVASPKRKAVSPSTEKKSKKKAVVVKSETSASESSAVSAAESSSAGDEDSPIKKRKKDGKRRKLVLESSSDDEAIIVDEKLEKSKTTTTKTTEKKATSPKIAKMFGSTKKDAKDSPAAKKETTKAISPVKAKAEAKSPVKSEPKEEIVKEVKEMKLVTPEESTTGDTKLFSKSTSNFFNGKKAESTTSGNSGSISVSNSSGGKSFQPNKEHFHPIDDACWTIGQPVPYSALAQTFYSMEQTTKRLELLSIVCNYFRSVLALTPKDLIPSLYLLTNKVAPDYDSLELGIGDTVLFKALAEATGCTVAKLKVEFQNKGDIGLVAEANRCNQKLIFTPKKLTVAALFTKLREIASISGNSSQNKKCDLIKGLLVSCDPVEARYVMRMLAGKLRNGLGEQSILSALAHACATTPPPLNPDDKFVADAFEKWRKNDKIAEIKEELEKATKMVKQAYNQCPNYEHVVDAIITHGLENVEKHCQLKPGVPLKPMLAYPTKGVQEILKRFDQIEFTCEYKYDGERAQIHILENGSIQVYSRNSENNTSKYPDIIEMLKDLLHLKSSKKESTDDNKETKTQPQIVTAVLDAEVVAYDLEKDLILPFQVLSTRKRKDANSAEIKIQVCIFAFDLLYLNGESLINKSFRKRREYLYEYFPLTPTKFMFAVNMNSSNLETIQEFLDKSVKDGCEGLMVKTLDTDAHYEISKRSHNWLKLKKDYLDCGGDSLDLVVIGGYMGTGKRTGVYGGYLLACYDAENEEYQTICKIGTGFKDDDLQKQFESLSKIRIDKPRSYYRVNDTLEQPDHWFEPEQVWEVKCADISQSPVHTAAIGILDDGKGISLRFPRYLRTREDKKAEDATSSEQVVQMYKNQQQMINQNQNQAKENESDENEDN